MNPPFRIIGASLIVGAIALVLFACVHEDKQTQSSPVPGQTGTSQGTLVMQQLPAGVDGVELNNRQLRLKPGFTFVKKPRHQFSIARQGSNTSVTSGGCGCDDGACDPVMQGGIIVCQGSCTGKCGLALTIAGMRREILRF